MPKHFRRLVFFECIGIQFFNLLTCDVTYGTLCHARGHSHFFPTPLVIPHSPVDYRQIFKPILYFHPNPAQSDSRLYPTPFFTVSATDLRERFLSGVFYLTLLMPREAEDFLRGDRHFKHVPPPTYLIYLSPKD